MAEKFLGEWVLDRNENFEEFLKEAGVNPIKAAALCQFNSILTITSLGNKKFKLVTVNGPKTKEYSFTLGQEFEFDFIDGTPSKATFSIENGKLVGKFINARGLKLSLIRNIRDDLMIIEITINGVTCRRYFKKV